MHRGRFGGGNARKRKAKLTDATFQAMIGGAATVEDALGTIDVAAEDEDGVVVLVAVQPGAAPVADRLPADTATGGAATRRFSCQDYQFGYAVCRNCHNDQAYYVHQADLANGYTFRCRVCRMEMTITAQA